MATFWPSKNLTFFKAVQKAWEQNSAFNEYAQSPKDKLINSGPDLEINK